MKAYFKLQFKLLNRTLKDMGSLPIFAYPLGILIFSGLSLLLFIKTEFAQYIYGVAALSIVLKASEYKRNEFLKRIFSIKEFRNIRTLENLIVVFPFVIFLVYKQLFIMPILLVFSSILLANFNFKSPVRFTIPTPFSKTPFEFPVGFRKTFYIFPLAYYLTFQSISSGNFNLGGVSVLLVGLVVLSYYSTPENAYYIWCFKDSAKGFMIQKIKTGLLFFTFLSLPIVISLLVFFPNEFTNLLVFIFMSYTYIITVILAKYSAYPYKMNLIEGMLIGISLMFMPLLIGIIPFLYIKSMNQLKPILERD